MGNSLCAEKEPKKPQVTIFEGFMPFLLNFLRLGIPCQARCVTLVCGWRSQHSVRALWQVMQVYFGGRQLSQLVEDEGVDGGQGGQGDCFEASLLSFRFESGGGQRGWLNF